MFFNVKFIFFFYIKFLNSASSVKRKIILKLKITNNLSFNFEQTIDEKMKMETVY